MGVNVTRVVKFIRKGEPGRDSVMYSIQLTPASVFVGTDSTTTTAQINAVAYRHVGNEKAIATDGTMYMRYTTFTGHTGRTPLSKLVTDGSLIYTSVVFEYQVGADIVAQQALQINRQGATLRGPQAWSDCAVGYKFQSGSAGEAWKDVVLYEGDYYSCTKSHSKTSTNYPRSTADQSNGYWQLGDKIELVATKILLASYALVKNLGVECIDMKDAAGNVIFRAKDGEVMCRDGCFENVRVSGDMTVSTFDMKVNTAQYPATVNGAVCYRVEDIMLPELPYNVMRSIRVLNPRNTTDEYRGSLCLRGENDNVWISNTPSRSDAKSGYNVVANHGLNSGMYIELLGIGNMASTYWVTIVLSRGV